MKRKRPTQHTRDSIPDTIEPTQWAEGARKPSTAGGAVEGERLLYVAVLELAVADLQKAGCGTRSPQAWFRSNDRTWPFSFRRVCEALDLNPDAVRGALGVGLGLKPVHVHVVEPDDVDELDQDDDADDVVSLEVAL